MEIRKGDTILVIAGKDRGKRAVVEAVLPKEAKVIATGINIMKRHLKKSRKHPAGGIVETAYPIHQSNVMLIDPSTDRPARVGIDRSGKQQTRRFKVNRQATVAKRKG